jgi:3-dehydroquinate dehydratase-2
MARQPSTRSRPTAAPAPPNGAWRSIVANPTAKASWWIGSKARGNFDALILNAGAYTHTSIAILDALLAVGLPVIEVHLSNIYRREDFRARSYVSKAAFGIIAGFGKAGYVMALDALAERLIEVEEA